MHLVSFPREYKLSNLLLFQWNKIRPVLSCELIFYDPTHLSTTFLMHTVPQYT